jgi:cell wall-associated NlpC family hydrolase
MTGQDAEPPLDPRVHPYRPDLAADWLEGRVEAERFVAAEGTVVSVGALSLRERPGWESRQASELLFGERLQIFDRRDGWAWGQNQTDGYVGWMPTDGLSPAAVNAPTATHEVAALRSYVFAEPDLKLLPIDTLHLSTRVRAVDVQGGWTRIDWPATNGQAWIWTRHLRPVSEVERDPVAVARMFMGAPYAWGGRSSIGVDCSGLVQLSLARCGRAAPRDSDQQEAAVGVVVTGGLDAARPGDLLYMKGHVVFVSTHGDDGQTRVLHANAYHMAVVEEPLGDFLERLHGLGLEITTVRRPFG